MIETRFKKTDIGKIPEDWEVKKLGNISNIKTGPFGSALHASDYVLEGTPIITVEHIGDIHINTNIPIPMINEQDKERLMPYSLKEGDIVFSRVGSVDRNSIITVKEEGWLFSGRLLRVRSYNFVNSLYLSYHLSSQQAKKRVISSAVGLAMPSINTKILSEIDIILPVLRNEQNRIATTLSDIDALLSNLSKKIEKKRLIRQGIMQQLLTGEKRLEGFNKPWIEKRLGDMSTMNSGGTPSSRVQAFYNGGIPFLSISDMTAQGKYIYSTEKKISELGLINSSARIVNKGTILYAMYASLGKCSISAIRMAISQAVLGINVNTAILDNAFLYYYLSFIENKVVAMGQTGTQSNLSKELVQNFVLKIPVDLTEQIAIATILSDVDAEIETLETKRSKYEQVKQGMMQQLLTGKIRLID